MPDRNAKDEAPKTADKGEQAPHKVDEKVQEEAAKERAKSGGYD